MEPGGGGVTGGLRIASFSLGPLGTNGFIVSLAGSDSCVLIDPGEEAPRLVAALSEACLRPQASAMAAAWGFAVRDPGVAFTPIHGGDRLTLGDLEFEVLHTPGHAPGHVAYYAPAAGVMFSGDLLFYDSIGRTDLPYSDPATMRDSLKRVMLLPAETRVLVGHGPETTIGREGRENPFVANECGGGR